MVGRLVEQKNVRRLHQTFADRQAFAPAAGQGRGGASKIRETRAAERLGDARSRSPSGTAARSRAPSITERTFRPAQTRKSARRKLSRVPLRIATVPLIRFHAAVQNLQQRRFAGAIRPDQADAIAFGHREGDILEKRGAAVSLRQPLCTDDRSQSTRSSPGLSLTL